MIHDSRYCSCEQCQEVERWQQETQAVIRPLFSTLTIADLAQLRQLIIQVASDDSYDILHDDPAERERLAGDIIKRVVKAGAPKI